MSTDLRDSKTKEPAKFYSTKNADHPETQIVAGDSCCSHDHSVSFSDDEHGHDHDHDLGDSYIPTTISLILLLSAIALDYINAEWFTEILMFGWFTTAYLLVGGKVLLQAAKNISKGDVFNEFFLMGIATIGAFYLGEYAEGVAVMLFYVIGEHFQERAVLRSRRSIKDLIDNRPKSVTVQRNGAFIQADPASVAVGEIIQVKAGEKVGLDGIMLSRVSSFNTAALTGESKPDTKREGEEVFSGMVNLDKVAEVKVTSRYEDSALSKILNLVEQANSRKAKTQKFITRFAKVYTPIVVFLAVALATLPYFFVDTYIFNEW